MEILKALIKQEAQLLLRKKWGDDSAVITA